MSLSVISSCVLTWEDSFDTTLDTLSRQRQSQPLSRPITVAFPSSITNYQELRNLINLSKWQSCNSIIQLRLLESGIITIVAFRREYWEQDQVGPLFTLNQLNNTLVICKLLHLNIFLLGLYILAVVYSWTCFIILIELLIEPNFINYQLIVLNGIYCVT